MSDNEWTAERIAEWRAKADEALPAKHAYRIMYSPDVLSLLDALESARAERDALLRAMRSNAVQIAENAAMLDRFFE